ncbi:FAD binding domain-containing protein [Shimia sp. R11_0]|uniref:FAD binding domain-containing protein n=1 Tax=Shimia sp. R11_0 TaxID=2821096 RepID=UPI001ADA0E33|nr:FAD binding domain-containing protein [Shimia sp. R11_0]MBO9476938.1 FAD binding domain-containing protein [Shimia sp. R11_0]
MGIYHRPDKLKDALHLLASAPVTLASGCTDLFAATEAAALEEQILDLTNIAPLKTIENCHGHWRFGAAVSWSSIVGAALPPAFDMLKAAARQVGGVQVQNAGTLGGNICNASPAADGVPPLLALDARVELQSVSGMRYVPLSAFITGPRQTTRRRDEIMTAILVDEGKAQGSSAFLKLGTRKHLVISIASVAVRLQLNGDRVAEAALAVGACSPVACRLDAVEAALSGVRGDAVEQHVTEADVRAALAPISDIRATSDYRLDSVPSLIRNALILASGRGKALE